MLAAPAAQQQPAPAHAESPVPPSAAISAGKDPLPQPTTAPSPFVAPGTASSIATASSPSGALPSPAAARSTVGVSYLVESESKQLGVSHR
jgi:hypothetical protein